jgi:integrase
MSDEHPNASPYKDRHGKERWRFRRAGKTVSLPHAPGHPEFEEAYRAVVEGREPRKAQVVKLPGAAEPRSFRAAWRKVVTETPEWQALAAVSQFKQTAIAEAFFASKVAPDSALVWGDAPIADVERRHIRGILAERNSTPHAAKHLLTLIRKMLDVAIDENWIKTDPAYRLKYRPETKGWRAWTAAERAAYELRWPIGTTPRLAYALALWLGNRRGDVATIKPGDIIDGAAYVTQEKTGRSLVIPITPMLQEVLAATDMTRATILTTAYGEPFSSKSLTGAMAHWTKMAGLAPGCTMHGLRKTLGKLLAESGATTRQIMDTLGHTSITHAELYSREADQVRLAKDGMDGVVRLMAANQKRLG